MDRFRSFFKKREEDQEEYQPLTEESQDGEQIPGHDEDTYIPFSWIEYSIFALLGVAMLWAWYGCTVLELHGLGTYVIQ